MSRDNGNTGMSQPTVLDDACPCDACPAAARCARESLACNAFRLYLNEDDWQAAERFPNKHWYRVAIEGKPQAIQWARRDDARARAA